MPKTLSNAELAKRGAVYRDGAKVQAPAVPAPARDDAGEKALLIYSAVIQCRDKLDEIAAGMQQGGGGEGQLAQSIDALIQAVRELPMSIAASMPQQSAPATSWVSKVLSRDAAGRIEDVEWSTANQSQSEPEITSLDAMKSVGRWTQ